MIYKYFLPILILTSMPKDSFGYSLVDAGLLSTQAFSHLFHNFSLKSKGANTPFGVFTHKTYKNLSELFTALHSDLSTKQFASKNVEYICTQVDLLSPKNWIVFALCCYAAYRTVAYGLDWMGITRRTNTGKRTIVVDGVVYGKL